MKRTTLLLLLLALSAAVHAQTSLKTGTAAPAFSGTSVNGSLVDLESMRGSVVMVTFWSTKCEICRHEMPTLNGFIDRFAGKKVAFLALSMESPETIKPYLRSHPTKLTVLPNSFGVVLKYADRDKRGNLDMGFPSYFLLDADGLIAYRSYGWDKTRELESRITGLLRDN